MPLFNSLEIIRINITQFLQIEIINNNFVFLQIWSVVHIIMGFIIMFFLLKNNFRKPFLALFALIFSFEIFEFAMRISAPWFFAQEPFIDFSWDLVIGMLGGYISYCTVKKVKF